MTLAFPNPSRSFDEVRNAVRFIGHDGMFGVPFFVEVGALAGQDRTEMSEAESLTASTPPAFRSTRSREAYSHGRQTSYTLTAADFR